MQNHILNFLKKKRKCKMIEKLNKINFIRIFSITYLMLFCVLKVFELTNIFKDISINTIMFVMGWIIIFLIFIQNKGKLNYSNTLIVFISAIIINMFFNFDIETIKVNLFEIFYVFVIYNIARQYLEEEYIKLIKIVLVISFVIVLAFFIKYILLCITSGLPTKNMISNIVFTNTNGGAILVILNIVMLNYMYKIKKINKWLAIVGNFYYIIFILVSKSRTSLLALIVLICYLLYNHFWSEKDKYIKLKKVLKIILISFSIIIIIILSFMLLKRDYNFNNKIDSLIHNVEQKIAKATSLRYWLWKYSIQELIDTNPLFGLEENFGSDSFNNIDDSELLDALSDLQKRTLTKSNLHNGYIQILVRNGLFGFITIMSFFTIFGTKILNIKSDTPYKKYIKYLYLLYAVVNLFENDIVLSNTFFVLLLWIHIGMDSNIIKNSKEIEK